MDALVRSQVRRDESTDSEGSALASLADGGISGIHATRHGFTEFLRAIEDVTKHPSSPVLDLFQ